MKSPPPPPPTPPSAPPPPPPFDAPSPTGSPAARFKPIWRLLLISNLALGAYIFARAGKRDKIKTADRVVEDDKVAKEVSASPPIDMDTYAEESLLQSLAMDPAKKHHPIPEEEKMGAIQMDPRREEESKTQEP